MGMEDPRKKERKMKKNHPPSPSYPSPAATGHISGTNINSTAPVITLRFYKEARI
jgi:hypothetical protein